MTAAETAFVAAYASTGDGAQEPTTGRVVGVFTRGTVRVGGITEKPLECAYLDGLQPLIDTGRVTGRLVLVVFVAGQPIVVNAITEE